MRNKLINIIARCNSSEIRQQWLLELSNADYECMESECTSCPVAVDCGEVFNNHYITPECKACGSYEISGFSPVCNGRCTELSNYKLSLDGL